MINFSNILDLYLIDLQSQEGGVSSKRYPAVFMRGGTSKALLFHARDLPEDRKQWDAIFLKAMGSPDPYGRQLNGMGGGFSAASKVCVIAPSQRQDADLDYTFAQVAIREASVDYNGNCGNMSSAVGPFAVDEKVVSVRDGEVTVRIFNTNTQKMIHSTFCVRGGRALSEGDLVVPGVPGTGAPIRLDFLDPGGASTGKLLPTGHAMDTLDVPGIGKVEASMIDAANACVFVNAQSLGIQGTELPEQIDSSPGLLEKISTIRAHASVAMGIGHSLEDARAKSHIPFFGVVSPAQDSRTLSGELLPGTEADVTMRIIANGHTHHALPVTGSVCIGVAARIQGTTVFQATRDSAAEKLRLAMPSGVLTVGAVVEQQDGHWHAVQGSLFRTTRRLFEGFVYA